MLRALHELDSAQEHSLVLEKVAGEAGSYNGVGDMIRTRLFSTAPRYVFNGLAQNGYGGCAHVSCVGTAGCSALLRSALQLQGEYDQSRPCKRQAVQHYMLGVHVLA